MAEQMTAIVDAAGEFCDDGMKPGRTVVSVPRNPDPLRERYSGDANNPIVAKTPNEIAASVADAKTRANDQLWTPTMDALVTAILHNVHGKPPSAADVKAVRTQFSLSLK